MTDRLNIEEFFAALKVQGKKPFIDTSEARQQVYENVKSLTIYYPIQDRWPVLDLESAYESYLNHRPDLATLVRIYGYKGVVNLDGFDEKYTMHEWFGDFIVQYGLKDTFSIRKQMLEKLPAGSKWEASDLYEAYEKSTKLTITNLFKAIFS